MSDTDKLAIQLREAIGSAKDYSQIKDFNQLFVDAEFIVSTMAYLVSPVSDMEQAYREKVVLFMEEGDSNAKAEAKAKATNEYRTWRKFEALMKLADEQVKLIKKFSDKLELEYMRTS